MTNNINDSIETTALSGTLIAMSALDAVPLAATVLLAELNAVAASVEVLKLGVVTLVPTWRAVELTARVVKPRGEVTPAAVTESVGTCAETAALEGGAICCIPTAGAPLLE